LSTAKPKLVSRRVITLEGIWSEKRHIRFYRDIYLWKSTNSQTEQPRFQWCTSQQHRCLLAIKIFQKITFGFDVMCRVAKLSILWRKLRSQYQGFDPVHLDDRMLRNTGTYKTMRGHIMKNHNFHGHCQSTQ
jgi:hypothetical protein